MRIVASNIEKRTDWLRLIEAHIKTYEKEEKPVFDRALKAYQGRFHDVHPALESQMGEGGRYCSFNLVFATVDSGIAALLPPNPQASAALLGTGDISRQELDDVNDVVNYRLAKSKARREQKMSLVESYLYGRFNVKTLMQGGKPVARCESPRRVFYDLTARRVEDRAYVIHATSVPKSKAWRRMYPRKGQQRLYKQVGKEHFNSTLVDTLPDWMRKPGDRRVKDVLDHELLQCVTIYEVYDYLEERVLHLGCDGTLLMDEEMSYDPWDIGNLHWDGEGIGGLSVIQLMLGLQDLVNEILTTWLRHADSREALFFYDAEAFDAEELASALNSETRSPNGFEGLSLKKPGNMSDFFWKVPEAPFDSDHLELLDRLEKIISVLTSMNDAVRGQVANVRTARELAMIDSYLRTQLAQMQQELFDVWSSVSQKLLMLEAKYVPETVLPGKVVVVPKDLSVELTMEAYSPARSNPAVRAENVLAALADLRSPDSGFDQRDVSVEVVDALNLNPDLKKTIAIPSAEPPMAPPGFVEGPMPSMPMPPGPAAPVPGDPAMGAEVPPVEGVPALAIDPTLNPAG